MNRLQPQFYLSFPVVQADYKTVLIDLESYSKLLRNAQFIDYLSHRCLADNTAISTDDLIDARRDFLSKKNNTSFKDYSHLQKLHLNVVRDSRPYIQHPEESNKNIYLMTEKFFWSFPTTNLGSGRHALLLDMQIKGIGKNPLAIRHDHGHSWGGQYLWQSMKSYIVGQLISGASPLGILKTPYVAFKQENNKTSQIRSSAVSLSIRESDALRVTQIMSDFDPTYSLKKEDVLSEILKRVNAKKVQDHLDQVSFHYASLFLMGFRHMAITRENVTLEGKLIDYEDIVIDSDSKSFKVFVLTHKCNNKVSKDFRRYEGDILYTSTIHFYLNAIKLTHLGFKQLDPSLKFDEAKIKSNFLKMVKLLSKEVFDVDPSLMSFIIHLINKDSIYLNSLFSLRRNDARAKETLEFIKKNGFSIEKEQNLGSEYATHYLVNFPRISFKNRFIEEYSSSAIRPTEGIIEKCFKLLQLEAFSDDLSFPQMLSFSSKCNEIISKHSLLYPYSYKDGKVKLKTKTLSKFKTTYAKKIKVELGARLESFDYVQDHKTKAKIMRGAKIKLTDGSEYYYSMAPQLLT